MKNFYITILSLGLLLAIGCRKEEVIIDDPIIITEPPTELEGAFFSGQVINKDGQGYQATVEVYQNGALQGEIETTEEGFYNTVDITLEVGPQVTFAVREENFIEKYRRLESDDIVYKDVDLKLFSADNSTLGIPEEVENPGSLELVKVFGTITDKYGTPVSGAAAIVGYDPIIFMGTLNIKHVFEPTDENGYFEVLVPREKEVFFLGVVDARDEAYECWNFLNQRDTTIVFPFDNLGVVLEDTEVIEDPNLSFEKIDYEVIGRLLDCNNTPVSDAEIKIKAEYFIAGELVRETFLTQEFDADGNFEIPFTLCETQEVKFEVEARLSNGFGYKDSFTTSNQGTLNLDVIRACEDLNIRTTTLDLQIGNDVVLDDITFFHPQLEAPYSINSTTLIEGGSVFLWFVEPQIGENRLDFLSIVSLGNDKLPYDFSSTEIRAEVTDISNGFINADLSGEVETTELGTQTITGQLRININ